ncbi:malic enzyme, NAD binding domain-containing protein [Ditylenchus destructor]|uniref:Malic enzyme n=1 Tax=Ditylenchus destructor TaxID=166010 RepID=A0AAD4NFJ0_9BILA|nr:malic enzyme, NAD binding domain-containing protein [Ditylenchus destructor]
MLSPFYYSEVFILICSLLLHALCFSLEIYRLFTLKCPLFPRLGLRNDFFFICLSARCSLGRDSLCGSPSAAAEGKNILNYYAMYGRVLPSILLVEDCLVQPVRCISQINTRLFAREWDQNDPKQKALYKLYRPERITPNKRGVDLIKTPGLNKGMAFTLYERQYLGLHGLLPPAFMTEEQQAYRVISKLRQQPRGIRRAKEKLQAQCHRFSRYLFSSFHLCFVVLCILLTQRKAQEEYHNPNPPCGCVIYLARYIQLDGLQDRNEKLFYRVLCDNIKELMPIVYTPTVGQACQHFGFIYRNPKGIYVTINDNSISKIHQILCNWPNQDVKAIVVTDGERILGLGDLGAYGIGIPVGKLALYVALAGIQPRWCLPVLIDVGTDNQKLLNDPFYIGLRRNRVRGAEYDTLMDNFMKAVSKKYGQNVLVQFEDFGNKNAYRLLDRYQKQYCMFNDDIQGTAAVVVAGLLASAKVTKKKMSQTKYVFLGAGGAATGVAEMCVRQMESEGLSYEEACSNIYMMDIDGLITKRRKNIDPRHEPFSKDMTETKDLLQLVQTVRPGALIGASTVRGAFTEEIIKTMAKINPRPIIFALSNPTSKAECTADDAYRITNGTVLFASGSPFKNVVLHNKLYKPGQGNNAYIFPGIALGVLLFNVSTIDNKLFLLAARKVAECVTEKNLNEGRIYPRLKEIREISIQIAIEIAEECYRDGSAKLYPEPADKEMFIRSQIYTVDYDELINKTYDWPEQDMRHGFPVPVVRRDSMDD